MLILAGFAFVIGGVLGLRYNVVALVPTAAAVLFCAVVGGVVHGGDVWSILISCGLTLTSIEFGYVLASAVPSPVLRNRSSEADRKPGGSEALPIAAPRPSGNWYEDDSPKTSSDVVCLRMIRRNAASTPSLSGSADAPASHS